MNDATTTTTSEPTKTSSHERRRRLLRPRPAPHRTTDPDGHAVVAVPLARGDRPARVDPQDFRRLIDLGLSPAWTFNSNGQQNAYVRAMMNGKLCTAARMIMNAGRGDQVSYRDGDPTNLRRDNLYFSRQRSYWRHLPSTLQRPTASQQPESAR